MLLNVFVKKSKEESSLIKSAKEKQKACEKYLNTFLNTKPFYEVTNSGENQIRFEKNDKDNEIYCEIVIGKYSSIDEAKKIIPKVLQKYFNWLSDEEITKKIKPTPILMGNIIAYSLIFNIKLDNLHAKFPVHNTEVSIANPKQKLKIP